MSVIEYNSIRFHFAKTASVEFDTSRDKSGVDVIANTTTIRARGVASLTSQVPGDSAALLPTIRHMLNMPRRRLLYQVGGYTIISQSGMDAQLGPTPVKPATVEPAGNGTFFVDVAYKVSTYDCGEAALSDPVTSLRWTQSESFDDRWFSTITTSGTLTVRSDLNQCADNFRQLATPPILDDYQRVSAKYTLAPDGLSLDFEFTDQEKSLLPPYPAVVADGDFNVICQQNHKRTGVVTITLEGAKGCSRKDLMFVGLRMAIAKLKAEGFIDGSPLMWGNFSENLFRPVVKVSVQALLATLGGTGFAGAAAASLGAAAAGMNGPAVMRSVGYTPGVQEGRSGIAPPVRKRLLGLLAAAFRDPCAASEGFTAELRNDRGGSGSNAELSTGGASLSTPPAELVTGTTGGAGTSPIKDYAPYDLYRIQFEYTQDTGKRVMPGTGVGDTPQRGTAVTVHGGQMFLEVSWACQRTGRPPQIPSFSVNDPNLVAIGGTCIPAEMQLSADGSAPTYRVAGHYIYGVLDPSLVSLTAPVPPYFSDGVLTTAPNIANFTAPVVRTGSSGSGYSGGGDYGSNIFVPEREPSLSVEPPSQLDLFGIPGPIGGGFPFAGPPGGLGSGDTGGGGLLPTNPVNP